MKILQNIDTSLKTMRTIMLTMLVLCFLFCSYVYFYSMKQIDQSRDKVYLLSQGNALELIRSRNGTDNMVAEIKNHVSMFHEFFYNLDPDPVDIKTRINKALFLIDESGSQIHSKREENLYYHKLIDGNMSSRVYIDSIIPVLTDNVYHCKIIARQKIIRTSSSSEKHIDAECTIRNVARTDNNPHGFLIQGYRLVNTKPVNEVINQ